MKFPRGTRPYTTAFLSTPKFMFQKFHSSSKLWKLAIKILNEVCTESFCEICWCKIILFFCEWQPTKFQRSITRKRGTHIWLISFLKPQAFLCCWATAHSVLKLSKSCQTECPNWNASWDPEGKEMIYFKLRSWVYRVKYFF